MVARVQGIRWCTFALLMVSVASVARAQSKAVDVEVAYQLLDRDDLFFKVGLNVGVSFELTRQFAVVIEAEWSRNSSEQFGLRDTTTALAVAGGIRWSLDRRRRLSPFGQLLTGGLGERIDIERFGADWTSSVLLQPGAGVVVRLKKRAEGFGEIDWRHLPQQIDGTNALRVLMGIRVNLRNVNGGT